MLPTPLADPVANGIYDATATLQPSPGVIIGTVDFDQDDPGVTNGVVVNASALPTGAATETTLTGVNTRLGEIQASPTTNTVLDRLKALLTGIVLAAGSAIIGKVGIDQTTPGTTNGVQINAALPAGTNLLGSVTKLGTLTDRSGTIGTGGTAQQMMASNATRRYLFILNDDTVEILWINFTTTAVSSQPSIPLNPGAGLVMDGSFVSTEAISVIAATTSHAWSAKEG